MGRAAGRICVGLVMAWLAFAGPASAQQGTGNAVCAPGILRADGSFDLARIGPLIAGVWSERAYGVSVATGVQTTSITIVHDAMRGRIYVQGDGVQLPLTIVRGNRYHMGWDYSRNDRPIHPDQRLLDPRVEADDAFLEQANCREDEAPQFSWQYRTPRGTSAGFLSFISPNAAFGSKWNSAMGAREVILQR